VVDAALQLEHFAPLVGSRFTLWLSDEAQVPARLVDARPGRGQAPNGRSPFSLTFEGPTEPALPQRIYRVEHPELSAIDIFLVPVGRTTAGLHYEAIFS